MSCPSLRAQAKLGADVGAVWVSTVENGFKDGGTAQPPNANDSKTGARIFLRMLQSCQHTCIPNIAIDVGASATIAVQPHGCRAASPAAMNSRASCSSSLRRWHRSGLTSNLGAVSLLQHEQQADVAVGSIRRHCRSFRPRSGSPPDSGHPGCLVIGSLPRHSELRVAAQCRVGLMV